MALPESAQRRARAELARVKNELREIEEEVQRRELVRLRLRDQRGLQTNE